MNLTNLRRSKKGTTLGILTCVLFVQLGRTILTWHRYDDTAMFQGSTSSTVMAFTTIITPTHTTASNLLIRTAHQDNDNSQNLNQNQNLNIPQRCKPISSREAANLIQKSYYRRRRKTTSEIPSPGKEGRRNNDDNDNNDDDGSLLIITSDASRGANRFTGLASILREIHDDSDLNDNTTDAQIIMQNENQLQNIQQNCINENKEKKGGDRNASILHATDAVTIVTRRTDSTNSKHIFKSEVAALALGIKTALLLVPKENRRRILLLTDCVGAIQFFCGQDILSHTCSHRKPFSYSHRQQPHYKLMETLLHDTATNNYDNQSREFMHDKQFVFMAKVKSAHSKEDGFFDHDLSDILSSYTKTVSNKDNKKSITLIRLDKKSKSITTRAIQRPLASSNKSNRDYYAAITTTTVMTTPLRQDDLNYLSNSESKHMDTSTKNKQQIQIKKESKERMDRCKSRVRSEFGFTLLP